MEQSSMSLPGIIHIVCTHYTYNKFFQMTPWKLVCMRILLQSNFNVFNFYYLATIHIFLETVLFCALVSNLWNSMPPLVSLCPQHLLAVPQISCFAPWPACLCICVHWRQLGQMSLHSNAGSHGSSHFTVLVSSRSSYNNWAFSEILFGSLHSLRSRLSF